MAADEWGKTSVWRRGWQAGSPMRKFTVRPTTGLAAVISDPWLDWTLMVMSCNLTECWRLWPVIRLDTDGYDPRPLWALTWLDDDSFGHLADWTLTVVPSHDLTQMVWSTPWLDAHVQSFQLKGFADHWSVTRGKRLPPDVTKITLDLIIGMK